jgi:hypothetical protein
MVSIQDKISPELMSTAIKWKIFYRPTKKDEEDTVAFTREFDKYWLPIMKLFFEENSETIENLPHDANRIIFIEYAFVKIISGYTGMNEKQYNNLPRRDPELLNALFEIGDMVFRLKDYDLRKEVWDNRIAAQEEMLEERKKFKDKIS